MLPDALLQAPNMEDWITLSDVARMMGKPAPSYAYQLILDHRINHERMFGQRRYYRPDVERALARKAAA